MRKWLIFLAITLLAIIATLYWLGQSLNSERPQNGEVRQEIEHVF